MAKSKFLRTKISGDDVVDKLMNSAARSSGTIGGLYVSHTMLDKWTRKDTTTTPNTDVPVIPKKYRGPLMFALGMAAEVYVEQPQVEAAAQGLQIAGALDMFNEFVLTKPEDKPGYGLSGIGNGYNTPENTANTANTTPSGVDYDAIYNEAMAEMNIDMYVRPEDAQPYTPQSVPVQGMNDERKALQDSM